MTDASFAPELVGLHPDHAARLCSKRGLELVIEDAEWVSSSWGHGQPGRVTEQVPSPGVPMSSRAIVVRVSLRDRQGGAGAREPRRPLPPDLPLQADRFRD